MGLDVFIHKAFSSRLFSIGIWVFLGLGILVALFYFFSEPSIANFFIALGIVVGFVLLGLLVVLAIAIIQFIGYWILMGIGLLFIGAFTLFLFL